METAHRARISQTTLSHALKGEQPTFHTCAALADTFDVPRETVLALAGHLPRPVHFSPVRDEWLKLTDGEEESTIREWIVVVRTMKVRQARKRGKRRAEK